MRWRVMNILGVENRAELNKEKEKEGKRKMQKKMEKCLKTDKRNVKIVEF